MSGKCTATSSGETGKSGRGQDIELNCTKSGRHLVHKDNGVGARFLKLGPAGDIVWPAK